MSHFLSIHEFPNFLHIFKILDPHPSGITAHSGPTQPDRRAREAQTSTLRHQPPRSPTHHHASIPSIPSPPRDPHATAHRHSVTDVSPPAIRALSPQSTTTMVVYSFYIFDRHSPSPLPIPIPRLTPPPAECIYTKNWLPPPQFPAAPDVLSPTARPPTGSGTSDDASKLIFGAVFSLRNMVRKLGGPDDSFVCYATSQYKLHYFETATNLRFVLLTDPAAVNMRPVLGQIYTHLWVEHGEFPGIFLWWGVVADLGVSC